MIRRLMLLLLITPLVAPALALAEGSATMTVTTTARAGGRAGATAPAATVASGPVSAPVTTEPAISNPPVTDDPGIPPNMTTYYIGFLKKGPAWTPPTPETEVALNELQVKHLAHIQQMGDTKKLVMAGPFTDGGDIRGILIFRTATMEEAVALAQDGPAVKAGRLIVEMHPWMTMKGILPDPETTGPPAPGGEKK